MNRTDVDETIVESICSGLFQRELYAEEELDEAGNIIYQPPPLDEVWVDEVGPRQGNEDRIGLAHARLGILDFFHDNDLGDIGQTSKNDSTGLEHHSLFCGPCVGSQANKHLSGPQK